MCPPAIGAAILGPGATAAAAQLAGMQAIGAAISAGSTLMQYKAQKDNAKAQQRANEINAQNALVSRDAQNRDLLARQDQEREKVVDKKMENMIQAAKARGRIIASAGEAGVYSGMSTSHILRDVDRTELRNEQSFDRNMSFVAKQTDRDQEGLQAQYENRVNNQPIVQQPSLLATGLQIGGNAWNSYEKYKTRKLT
jgi:hypothetical protein